MPNLRPDVKDYVGPAGFLYDSIGDVADIISKPFPEELRQLGFEHAKKSDVFRHKRLLINLWRKAIVEKGPQRTQHDLPRFPLGSQKSSS